MESSNSSNLSGIILPTILAFIFILLPILQWYGRHILRNIPPVIHAIIASICLSAVIFFAVDAGFILFAQNQVDYKFAIPGCLIIGTIVFCLLIKTGIYKRFGVQKEPNKITLGQDSPNIKVEPHVYHNCAKLEVTNNGKEADFTATFRVTEGIPKSQLYTMCWEPQPVVQRHISKGEPTSIIVAEIAKDTIENDDIVLTVFRGGLALFILGEAGKQRIGATTAETIEIRKLNQRYPTMRTTYKDKCIIEITLTSVPALLVPFTNRKYSLEIDDQNHLFFNELPISDKEVSIRETDGIENKGAIKAKHNSKHDKLLESLTDAKAAAEELIKLGANEKFPHVLSRDASIAMVILDADSKYKNLIKGLNNENPIRGSKYEKRISYLKKLLFRGHALLEKCRRRDNLSKFRTELDENSKAMTKTIKDIIANWI